MTAKRPSGQPFDLSAATDCPSQTDLLGFSRGKLPLPQLEAVGGHLARCPSCEALLSTLGDDSDFLIANLRTPGTAPLPLAESCRRLEDRAKAIPLLAGAETRDERPGHLKEQAPGLHPRQLGPYRIVRVIRAGGMGVVYEAWHTKLKRPVALKTLRFDRMDDAHMVARFHREMAVIGQLDHPNIVHALDADEVGGCHFLVMEFVDGLDLGEIVRLLRPLEIADACEVVRQAAVGLEYVFTHGLVHRDVKPSNLMLTARGEVKLLDLGLALLYGEHTAGDELSEVGHRLGTADYMAPEQARDAHTVDIRADLYSLGCTLYKLLTGRPPFAGTAYDTILKKMQAHAEAPVPSARTYCPNVPAALAVVLERLLAKNPAERFAEPLDVARILEPFTAGCDPRALLSRARRLNGPAEPRVEDALSASSTPRRIAEESGSPGKKRPFAGKLALTIGFLTAFALLGVALWQSREQSGQHPTPSPAPPPRAAVTWPADYPAVLRERPWEQPVEILALRTRLPGVPDLSGARGFRGNDVSGERLYQPLWCRRLLGTGLYHPFEKELQLRSRTKDVGVTTLLALDDDLERRWFEFTAELPQYTNDALVSPRGLFFGWQEDGAGKVRAYFVQLDLQPAQGRQYGRLLVGLAVLDIRPGRAEEAAIVPLPVSDGKWPRSRALTRTVPNYSLSIRARPGAVTVQVKDEQPIEFEPSFDPRGPLGIWVQRGGGRFRTATITALRAN
ncbi:MAG TPA: serine/threonine-protein kinase [Gemmataceae bacterium]|nr:serine/threonine-protein kinase [Gemmataceae bacterium]